MQNVKVFIQGCLGNYAIADMMSTMEDWNGWLHRKAVDVYQKTVEEAENTRGKSHKVRHGKLESLSKREHPQELLGCCQKWHPDAHQHKRKTCTCGPF